MQTLIPISLAKIVSLIAGRFGGKLCPVKFISMLCSVSILWPMVVAHSISQLVEMQLLSFVEDLTVNTGICKMSVGGSQPDILF